ncbi:helix-turn-helix domain-containing protein [Microbacterium sp. 1P10AE]|uniref:helix-turn-helix domain-containing protein n=1 Tax=Microbacterium sp. 1P10AE TaxID=3132286 RepID=UPI0039A20485
MNARRSTFGTDQPRTDDVDGRASLVAQLVDTDPERRRESLRAARSRRWIDVYGDVVVRAVVVDGAPASREELVHTLSVSGRGHSLVLEDGDAILVVTSPGRSDLDVDGWIRDAAARAGTRVIGAIGSAGLRTDEQDLQRAADDARATTELLVLVGGDAIGTTRAEDLGVWRLLHTMSGSPDLVAAASPAADELWRAPDPMRRTTVEAYLDSGCNVAVACRALFIHRTTLYYRLESMPETVRDALADGLQRSTLHLGLKLLRLWEGKNRPDAVPPSPGATITPIRPRQASKRASHPVL